MRKKVILLVSLALSAFLLVSCTKDSENKPEPEPTPTPTPEPEPEPETKTADYTVLIFGCGGGDLDPYAVTMMRQCLAYGSTESVKVAIEYNFSKQYQSTKPLPGTVRLAVPDSSIVYRTEEASIENFLSFLDSLSLTEVLTNEDKEPLLLADDATLTDFIDWGAGKYPARNYILVLWNHGSGWDILDDATTKSSLLDDNHYSFPLDLQSLVTAVKKSTVKRLKCIYHDACMMCTLENYSEYKNIADYSIGSTSPASVHGGDYNMLLTLLNGLSIKEDSEFKTIMSKFCDYTIQRWSAYTSAQDISFTDLNLLDTVTFHVKNYIDTLVKVYPSDSAAINRGIRSSLAVLKRGSTYYPLIDIEDLFDKISQYTNVPSLMYMNIDVSAAIKSIKHTASSPGAQKIGNTDIGFSVYFSDSTSFATVKDTYKTTAFDKTVGWSRFLEINGQPFDKNPYMVEQKLRN